SMSVNQKRTYSTPSFSISRRTALRASGSDVARSLLSIIATVALLSEMTGRGLSARQRTLHRQHARPVFVAQAGVQGLHRLVALLRPRDQLDNPAGGGPVELSPLQRPRDPAPAVVTADDGKAVLRDRRPVCVLRQPR